MISDELFWSLVDLLDVLANDVDPLTYNEAYEKKEAFIRTFLDEKAIIAAHEKAIIAAQEKAFDF